MAVNSIWLPPHLLREDLQLQNEQQSDRGTCEPIMQRGIMGWRRGDWRSVFYKLLLKMKQAKVEREMYKMEWERKHRKGYRLLTARDVLFALQIAVRVCGCLSGGHPAARSIPDTTRGQQHFITSACTRAYRVSACWWFRSSPPAISLQPKNPSSGIGNAQLYSLNKTTQTQREWITA